jgi:uncharacterized protein
MTVFIDSSVWFASVSMKDLGNSKAKSILSTASGLLTTELVVAETWSLLFRKFHWLAAERFWGGLRTSGVCIEKVLPPHYEHAWMIGSSFTDQEFSLVDRTSFAVMERLGLSQVASFDDDFAIYRFGPDRDRAFDVLR